MECNYPLLKLQSCTIFLFTILSESFNFPIYENVHNPHIAFHAGNYLCVSCIFTIQIVVKRDREINLKRVKIIRFYFRKQI